ncbi:ABC transporter [Bacillus sp. UMB0899]|uniref:ABC transporter permease n=1 Tax=Metabacillus schmidteae TaxID=2730405 RepID=UPI000C7F99C3|nr:ABC transporter permease subunit [Metabacillus schmidteae]PMC36729.1 ABC transporter [Bacillus sp. UMB0899]
MTFSFKRTLAIFQKDYKDISKNMYVSFTAIIPLFMALLYGSQGEMTIDMQYIIINMTLSLVAAFIQCSLIAEEKEKNTLRGLMLSPASTVEILTGKGMLTFLATIFIIAVSCLLIDYKPKNIAVIAVAIGLSTLFYIGLGTFLGLMTKSVMEASVIIMPFFFLFTFSSYALLLVEKFPILKAVEYMPNSQLVELAGTVESGAGFADVWSHLLVISIWTVAIFFLAYRIFKKRMMD